MNPSDLLRSALLTMSHSAAVRSAIEKAPVSRSVVKRFVAGERVDEALDVTTELRTTNRTVTIDYLGEDTTDISQAQHTRDMYLQLLRVLADAGLSQNGLAEVSLKLSALGQALPGDGERVSLEHARQICEAAKAADTTVTIDMEDHRTVDKTLGTVRELRADFPWVGAVLQSQLLRTEGDCRDLAGEGSRIRLCKGAYAEPESVAHQEGRDVDLAYIRCLKILFAGQGYPMFATHDPRLIEIIGALADQHGRDRDTYEFQMLYGVRPEEQRRIADRGNTMRVYIPFGDEWYGYLMRRMAERPANLTFFLRSLATTS